MILTRFSGHLLITLKRLKCLDIPNLERQGFTSLISKIKVVELSLRDDVMSKDIAEALGIHSLKAQGVYVILKTKTTVYPLLTFLVRLVELIEPK
ncbi:hypothetical protein ATW7_02987 [Alteromonadales bacterium TW-7]|nr:hypothetical protein ATW7_02987 [Alteromonadales bacterium TW-7]